MHLPPKWVGYKHFGTEVFYNEDFTSYKVCDGSGEDETCADQYWFPDHWKDHYSVFRTYPFCFAPYKGGYPNYESLKPSSY